MGGRARDVYDVTRRPLGVVPENAYAVPMVCGGQFHIWPLAALTWLIGCSSQDARLPTYDDAAGWTGCAATSVPGDDLVAVLSETASTNSRSIAVAIFGDGSATRTVGPPTRAEMEAGVTELPQDPAPTTFPPGSPQVEAVLRDLACIGNVSAIPILGDCPKSTSFGTETTIQFAGSTSGDLECFDRSANATALAAAGRQLYLDCVPLL